MIQESQAERPTDECRHEGAGGRLKEEGIQSANSTVKFTTVNFIALRRRGSPERAEGRHQKGVLVWRAAKQVDE